MDLPMERILNLTTQAKEFIQSIKEFLLPATGLILPVKAMLLPVKGLFLPLNKRLQKTRALEESLRGERVAKGSEEKEINLRAYQNPLILSCFCFNLPSVRQGLVYITSATTI